MNLPVSKSITYSPGISNYSVLCTFIFLLISQLSFAQSETVQRWLDAIEATDSDTAIANYYNELSYDLRAEDLFDSAMSYADSAMLLSREVGHGKGIATAYSRYGEYYYFKNERLMALAYYDSSFRYSKEIGFLYGQARASNQMCLLFNQLAKFDTAVFYGRNAVTLFKKTNPYMVSRGINNLSVAFNGMGQYDSSIVYFNQGIDVAIELGDVSDQADLTMNLGTAYDQLKNYPRALEYNEKAEQLYESVAERRPIAKALSNQGNALYKMKQIDEAEQKYLASLKIKTEEGILNTAAPEYSNLGNIYLYKKDWRTAETYFKQSLDLRIEQNDPDSLISLLNLGNLTKKQGKIRESLSYYNRAFKAIQATKQLRKYPEVLTSLSELFERSGNVEKALEFSAKHSELKDQIEQELIRLNNLELEIAETRSDLALSEANIEQERLKSSRQQITFIGLSVVFILMLILLYIRSRNVKLKADNLEKEKEQATQNERIVKLIQNQEKDTISAMMEGQEKERTRLAREIHDRLGGMLSIIKLNFQSIEASIEALKEKNIKQYKQANQMLDEASEEVRKIARDMTSGVLVKLGLNAALNDLKIAVENSEKLKVNITVVGLADRLKYDYEINVYRIVQELLTNTLKHAQASEINIQLFKKEHVLNIVVDDDGKGFKPEEIPQKEGMGLDNIKSRVAKFDGSLVIDSGLGGGTTFTIDLPLKED